MSPIEPWTSARTWRDFGECTAQWLERRIGNMPTYSHVLEFCDETRDLVPLLALLNRSAIIVTRFSQPACTPDNRPMGGIMSWQRAAVMGFVPSEAIGRVRTALTLKDVELQISPPGGNSAPSTLLVSRRRGRNITWFGYVLNPAEIARDYGGARGRSDLPGLRRSVIAALQGCYQVTAVDQEWGRNTVLWPALEQLTS